jgi:hypothetical protein
VAITGLIYDSVLLDMATGAVDFDTDTFYVMLLSSSYTPSKGGHDRRNDLTNEITATGYTAGGKAATISVGLDTTLHRLAITLGSADWTGFTGTFRYAAYYKRRGGASSADELVALNDQGTDVTFTGTTLALSASTVYISNPN